MLQQDEFRFESLTQEQRKEQEWQTNNQSLLGSLAYDSDFLKQLVREFKISVLSAINLADDISRTDDSVKVLEKGVEFRKKLKEVASFKENFRSIGIKLKKDLDVLVKMHNRTAEELISSDQKIIINQLASFGYLVEHVDLIVKEHLDNVEKGSVKMHPGAYVIVDDVLKLLILQKKYADGLESLAKHMQKLFARKRFR